MGKPKMPKGMQYDPIEMIEKNAEVNRISQNNPYGSSQYNTDAQGNTSFDTTFSPELEELRKKQMAMVGEGSIKDPLANLGEQGGGAVGDLMSSMFGKVKDRYMGTEGEGDSRHGNLFKGGGGGVPAAETSTILGDGGTVTATGTDASASVMPPADGDGSTQGGSAAAEEKRKQDLIRQMSQMA